MSNKIKILCMALIAMLILSASSFAWVTEWGEIENNSSHCIVYHTGWTTNRGGHFHHEHFNHEGDMMKPGTKDTDLSVDFNEHNAQHEYYHGDLHISVYSDADNYTSDELDFHIMLKVTEFNTETKGIQEITASTYSSPIRGDITLGDHDYGADYNPSGLNEHYHWRLHIYDN
jgi:hypothetical protein